MSYFNKEKVFFIRKTQKIDKIDKNSNKNFLSSKSFEPDKVSRQISFGPNTIPKSKSFTADKVPRSKSFGADKVPR